MRIDIITIFPEYFGPLRVSLLGKAVERGIVELEVHDLRMWARDAHRTVDDAPFGGGPGMVMTPGPWGEALDVATGGASAETLLVVPTPAGIPFRQEMAAAYARYDRLVFACGRYEGIDARVIEATTAIFFYGTRLREQCEEDHDLGYELMKRMTQVVIQRLQATRKELLAVRA